MSAPKGNKFAGSRKGRPNKRTEESLKRIEYVLGLLDQTIDKDIKALESKERAKMWSDLQEYIRPKLARSELVGKDGEPLADYSQYTFEQLYQLKYGKRPS
jgi:hypothetical protein